LPHEDIVKNVLSKVREIRGVHQASVLTDNDIRRVLDLEKEAEMCAMIGLGRGDNQGVKTALQRDVVIAFVTDKDYVWPTGPNFVIKWKDRVVGEEVTDSKRLDELKKMKSVVLVGNFALYKDRMPSISNTMKEPPTVLFPPKQCLEIKEVEGVRDAVQGSPCSPTDRYLKKRMGASMDDARLGTVVMGFDLETD